MKDLIDVGQWLESKWDSGFFPVIFGIFVFVLVLYIKSLLPEVTIHWYIWILIGVASAIAAISYWFYKHKIPKVPKGAIGIVVAIVPDEQDVRAKTVKDFVASLQETLQVINLQHTQFVVIELSKYHSRKITNNSEATEYCKKCKSHFLVFGHSKVRKSKGKDYHAVKLKGLVTHAPISLENSSVLAGEMQNLMPLDFKVSCENDLAEFEAVSLCFSESAKYIIATAAMLSNDIKLAVDLLTQLNNSKKQLEKHRRKVPTVSKLLNMIPNRLATLHDILGNLYFELWRRDRDANHLQLSKEYKEMSAKVLPSELSYLLVKAIWFFVIQNNVNAALLELRKCSTKYIQAAVCRYSIAFLYAYSGDMKKALREYEAAFILDSTYQTAFEVEEFISWILAKEPEKYQLWFCLGLINLRIKNDKESSANDFRKFIECDINNSFPLENDKAKELLQGIDTH